MIVFAYTRRPPLPIELTPSGLVRTEGAEARLYAWIRATTPEDAVFVQDPGRDGRTCTGNTSELPAFTGRALFTDYAAHYLVAPHRDALRRVDLAQRLARGEAPDAAGAALLGALRRPLYLIAYDVDDPLGRRLVELHGAPLFEAGALRVHSLRSAP